MVCFDIQPASVGESTLEEGHDPRTVTVVGGHGGNRTFLGKGPVRWARLFFLRQVTLNEGGRDGWSLS